MDRRDRLFEQAIQREVRAMEDHCYRFALEIATLAFAIGILLGLYINS